MDMTSGETATDRRIYQITGADALPFLQGLTSNDVLPLAKSPGIVWTALLTPQGKYLADFFVVNTGETLLLDINESLADTTLRRLTMYKLRSDVAFGQSAQQQNKHRLDKFQIAHAQVHWSPCVQEF
jgi:folate-binding Fe-S cluster repair protein YgfZ